MLKRFPRASCFLYSKIFQSNRLTWDIDMKKHMGRALRNMLNGLINSPASCIVGAGESYAERTLAGTLSRREEKVYTKLPHLILARRRCLQYHARQVWADGRNLNWPELRAPTNLSAIIILRTSLLQVMRLLPNVSGCISAPSIACAFSEPRQNQFSTPSKDRRLR